MSNNSPRKVTAHDELENIQKELEYYRNTFTQIYQLTNTSSSLSTSSTSSSSTNPLKTIQQLSQQILQRSIPSPTALSLWLSRPRVGVGVILIAPNIHPGRILIGQRKGSHGVGKYALPGGHLEGNETFEQCAQREIAEEVGIQLELDTIKFLTTTNDIMGTDGGHYVTVFMGCIINKEQVDLIKNAEPDKCEGWVWLPWEDVQVIPKFMPLQHFLQDGGQDLVEVFEQTCFTG